MISWCSRPMLREPWFANKIVLISHAFVNWRLSDVSDPWRWALLPTFYAEWRKRNDGRYPRYYLSEKFKDTRVYNAAQSICSNIDRKSTRLNSSHLGISY